MAVLRGSELRDEIARVLRLKYSSVETEKRLVATTADVFFLENSGIFTQKIGIEAKDWKKSLTSTQIADIERLYRSSIDSGEIDALWIIGKHSLASSPNDTVRRMNKVRYSTVEEFRSSLMNFEGLLINNINAFQLDDSSKNFIQARVRDTGQKLIDAVREWVVGRQTGLMIYGGYGIGKTTFSYYLSQQFSQEYRVGRFPRIPIRISLGSIFTKQDLSALICSNLLGGELASYVPGFNFGLFMEANKQGLFLLILDGFDEMRHAMDLEDFVFTFDALKPLFVGRAKVVILGRPDSFLSNSDEEQILSALYERKSAKNELLGKVEIDFLIKNEISTYIDNFLAARGVPLTEIENDRYNKLLQKLPETKDNILSRPIQLKMFTAIIDEFLDQDVELTRYAIYERFIYRFVGREMQKKARQYTEDRIDDRARRVSFMQSIAWWVISEKKENKFLPSEIPSSIIPKLPKRRSESEAAIREAIVGSVIEPITSSGVLDKKANRFYYFPHKSYMEFLVAQYFGSKGFSKELYVLFLRTMNPEILSFVEEGPISGVENLRRGLGFMLSVVDFDLILVCALKQDIAKELDKIGSYGSASDIYVHYAHFQIQKESVSPYVIRRIAQLRTVSQFSAIVNIVATLSKTGEGDEALQALVLNCISSLQPLKLIGNVLSGEKATYFHADIDACRAAFLLRCTKIRMKNPPVPGELRFVVSIGEMQDFAQSVSRGTLFSRLPVYQNDLLTEVTVDSSVLSKALQREHMDFIRFLSTHKQQGGLWPILLQGEAESRYSGQH